MKKWTERKWIALLASILLLLAGCSTGSTQTIKIGAQPFSEQLIQAHMIKKLLEAKGLTAEIVPDLSSTAIVHQAMLNNDIQISIRYVGTDLSGTFKMKDIPKDPNEAIKILQERFAKEFNQTWFPSWGFENAYAFTVRKEIADKLGLQKISDLQPHAQNMKLGTDSIWLERSFDGYPVFKELYGFSFGKTSPMDVGLLYKAVKNGEVDIVLGYSTDARIQEYNLKVLEDDKKLFPPYQVSNVVRNDLLEKQPKVKEVMDQLVGIIDNATMTKLNYQVDVQKQEPDKVAEEFLKQKGLIKK
jgi:osmoprotectant transport system substrate-binding protein